MKTTPRFALGLALAMTIAMSPAGFAQDILIEPDSLNFGTVPIGLAGLPWNYREVTITNQSNSDLTLQINTVNLPHPEDFELFSPEAVAIHPVIRQIFDAVGCYRQDYGEDPSRAYEMAQLGYLDIDEELLWRWQFSLIGQDPIVQIEAVSTDGMVVLFDVQTENFMTYHRFQQDEPLSELEVSSRGSITFLLKYSPLTDEQVEGWITFSRENNQQRLYVKGSGISIPSVGFSTKSIDFGEVYSGRRVYRNLQIHNTAETLCSVELQCNNPDQFYVYSSRVADAHDFILETFGAISAYHLNHNEDPSSVEQLIEYDYLEISEQLAREWTFSLIGSDPVTQIEGVTTSESPLGAGHVILYDTYTSCFDGIGFFVSGWDNFWLGRDRDADFIVGFVPDELGNIGGSLSFRAYTGDFFRQFQDFEIALNGVGLSVSGQEDNLLPRSLTLAPPFPNPFNSTVTIPFSAGLETGATRLAIFDPSGRRVAELIPDGTAHSPMANGLYAAGKHSAVWDAIGMPAGQYIVRLEAGNQQLSQRLSLVK